MPDRWRSSKGTFPPLPLKIARRIPPYPGSDAARRLGEFGVPGVQLLVDAFCQNTEGVTRALVAALDQMDADHTIHTLVALRIDRAAFERLLGHRRDFVRDTAARILGHSGDRRWVPLLATLLASDRDSFVRCRAAEALGHLADPAALPALVAAIEDTACPARLSAVEALAELREEGVRELKRCASAPGDEVLRRVASSVLAHHGGRATFDYLLGLAANHGSAEVRSTTVAALGRTRDVRALDTLTRLLREDPAPEVRELAAEALGRLGNAGAIEALLDAARQDAHFVAWCSHHEPHPPDETCPERIYPVRMAATEALSALGALSDDEAGT